ncbi:MAG: Isomerizing Glutamine-fructose-6-phosphate aminotransferase [candidate division TM6 bacterium GW2011_GWF2_37_49]|nr:MAG: Isomerizing Glutamine-fructose-6-phosphate aminotransferase [candidate division TM6 bacterium GW2011_GWF2_37_49]
MCGIVAYVGSKPCREFVLDGLLRLEYRGYDSAGFVCVDSQTNRLSFFKEVGGVSVLKKAATLKANGFVGMGHTRWATHGVVDQKNAHPHFNCKKTIAVVHNGIIESYMDIKAQLIKEGHNFCSTTDSEVVAHLFSSLLQSCNDLNKAAQMLAKTLKGAFALVFTFEDYPDILLAIRSRSPLVIGLGIDENFVASDPLAFSDKTSRILFLPDECFAIVKKDSVEVFDFDNKRLEVLPREIDSKYMSVDKQDFEHYMLKEIYEQKRAVTRTLSFYKAIGFPEDSASESVLGHRNIVNSDSLWRQIGLSSEQVKDLRYLNIVAAGTSWHAARIGQFFFEIIAKIPTKVYLSSEFRYMPFFVEKNSAFLFISQSGETADTLEALRLVNSFEVPTITLTNVSSSTMVRESTGFLPMQAGPEISVASTKSFSTQIASLYWLAHRAALERGLLSWQDVTKAEEELFVAAEILESTLDNYRFKITSQLAPFYAQFDKFIFLGRHVSYPFALEAALKLKEVSYIFAQCYPAGELKHGPIALVDKKTPVVIFSSLDDIIYHKLVSNAQEVKAREGHLIVFAFEGQTELLQLADCSFVIPRVKPLLAPLAMTGVMQFLVYQISHELRLPIDKPRNLAKSVTVE